MQIFVAFAGRGGDTAIRLQDGIARVHERYEPRWAAPPQRHSASARSAGIALWQSNPISRWPAWVQDGEETVASLYAPVGFERLVTPEPLDSAPLRLARELRSRPASIEAISPPFVCASLEGSADRLMMHTDALGIGRLFEVRTAWGWVWSNRPEAALAFADLPATADEVGWAHIAVADELFGHVSPYEGVRVIDAATFVDWDGHAERLTVSVIDTVSSWASADHDAQSGELIESAAEQLAGIATSVTRLFEQRPLVDLTGGRDSRLVAAAFLAAGTDVRLHTHDALPGDLQAACELVSLLDDPPEHQIEHVATGGVREVPIWDAMENADAWHKFAEGLRPFSYLHYSAQRYLDEPQQLAIGGAGGEVAHGFFYSARREEFEQLPVEAMLRRFSDSILQRYAPVAGAHPEARALVHDEILSTLRQIADRGYRNATALDVFYVRERIRRWGSTGERIGIISPLLAPSFLRASLSLTPAQRGENVLHRELTRRLMPVWADLPYYPGEYARSSSRPRPAAPRVIRVGDARDRDAVNSLIHDRQAWSAAFDTDRVDSLWAASTAGETDAREERILRAVVWRGAFTDHLAGLGGFAAARPVVTWAAPIPPLASSLDRITAVETDRAVPAVPVNAPVLRPDSAHRYWAVRRMASTRLWRELRGTRIGSSIRAGVRAGRRRGLRV